MPEDRLSIFQDQPPDKPAQHPAKCTILLPDHYAPRRKDGGNVINSTFLGSNAGVGRPGGFDGGNGSNGIASPIGRPGLGPGGGAGGGGFAAVGTQARSGPGGPAYGSPELLPLIGGLRRSVGDITPLSVQGNGQRGFVVMFPP